jgi:hypothetical protein
MMTFFVKTEDGDDEQFISEPLGITRKVQLLLCDIFLSMQKQCYAVEYHYWIDWNSTDIYISTRMFSSVHRSQTPYVWFFPGSDSQ